MRPVSLHNIKAKFTIVFFWDPTCSHCKKEVPKLVDFYNREHNKLDLKIFAVCSDTNMAEMKKYIRLNKLNFINVNGPRAYTSNFHDLYDIYSTPVIYLLDENKKILAKRLLTDQLETFINRFLKNESQGPYGIRQE
jgi:thiol-disulfide isomerase/thioredoxin